MTNENSATAGTVRPRPATPGIGDARARSPRQWWRSAALLLALAAVLACASGVSEAAVTLLDNTNAGTMALPTGAGTNVTIRSNRYFAYSFSTSSNQTLGSVTLGLVSDTGGLLTRDTTISLYNAAGSLPSGAAIAQSSTPITVTGTPQYYTFALPASFAITAGNSYSLAFAIDTAADNNFRWNYGNPVAFPTGSNGVSFLGAAESNGTSWSAETVIKPTMFVEAAAVPEPATWMLAGIAIAGGLGYRRLRRRKGSGTAVLCSLLAVCMVGVLSLSSQPASAALIIEIQESGSDVVVSFSGSLNLNDLPAGTGGNWSTANNMIRGGSNGTSTGPFIGSGVSSAAFDTYNANDGSAPLWTSTGAYFGTAATNSGGVATGDVFQFYANSTARVDRNYISVPAGYSAGDPLSGSETFAGESFASLGLIEGASSTWTWGAGVNADSLTVNVVPEPSSFALCGVAVAGLGFAGVRRVRRRVR